MWILATFKEKAATFNYAYHTMLSLYQYLFVNLVVSDMGFCEPLFSLCQFLIIALIPSTSMPCHNRSESTNSHHFNSATQMGQKGISVKTTSFFI